MSRAPPFLVAEHKTVGSRNIWAIQGEEASLATVPALAKELFGDLIRMSSGKMEKSELFSRSSEQPKLGENVAVGYSQAPAPALAPEAVTLNIDETHLHEACDVLDKGLKRNCKSSIKPLLNCHQALLRRIRPVSKFLR